eukprot:GHVQ01025074.1.p1 GENE.GHVQ01025074.1~~GHVQ01025074.1.p1  ORF type:complete len:427 (-),score=48.86 GHVQ01025074.1:202-1482(-)
MQSQAVLSVSSHTEDQVVCLWDIRTHSLLEEIRLRVAGSITMCRSAGALVAIGRQGGGVCVVDMVSKATVREFKAAEAITDLLFSPDNRWLLCSADSNLYVFDLLSSCLVDWLTLDAPVCVMKFVRDGAYLLSSHHIPNQQGGLCVWSNKRMFESEVTHSSALEDVTRPIYVVKSSRDAQTSIEESVNGACDTAKPNLKLGLHAIGQSPDEFVRPLNEGLVTLSGVSAGRLQTTLYLDDIKSKSKPKKNEIKARQKAPFFMPSRLSGNSVIQPSFGDEDAEPVSIPIPSAQLTGSLKTKLQLLLQVQPLDHEEILRHLVTLSASSVHLALQELGTMAGGNDTEILRMLEFFDYHVKRKHQADLVQVYLTVFLKYHRDVIQELLGSIEAETVVSNLTHTLRSDWQRLDGQFQKLSCTIKFLTHLQMD